MYTDVVFLLGAGTGFVSILVITWVIDMMMKTNLRKQYLYQSDVEKVDILERLENIKCQLAVLQNKTNDKYLRMKYNQFIDLIAFLRKRNLG